MVIFCSTGTGLPASGAREPSGDAALGRRRVDPRWAAVEDLFGGHDRRVDGVRRLGATDGRSRRARDRHRQRRRAPQPRARRDPRVGHEVEPRRLDPPDDRFQRAPDRRAVAGGRLEVPGRHAQARLTGRSPGARLDGDPGRDPRRQRRVAVHDRVLADEDHLAVAEAAPER